METRVSEEFEALMSQGPGDFEVAAFELSHDGFGIVDPTRGTSVGDTYGSRDAGMTAHRGVLVGDEYIDQGEIRAAVEQSLGYSYEDVSSVYRQGRLSPEQRQLRARIDARLLALSRAGGNMTMLADALDLGYSTIKRAIARAGEHEITPIVKRPAVITSLVCFKTSERGARAQRRLHRGCPGHLMPEKERRYSTINLLDSEYAKGFETRPGNSAYWDFRLRV